MIKVMYKNSYLLITLKFGELLEFIIIFNHKYFYVNDNNYFNMLFLLRVKNI